MVSEAEKFCLKWNDFETNLSRAFSELREEKDFFDVTLVCEDNQLDAHKVILSACSPFFRNILKKNPHKHPLLYLKDVRWEDMQSILTFMYQGEVNVAQDQLTSFLAVAEDLKVKGLTQSPKSDPHSSAGSKESKPEPSHKRSSSTSNINGGAAPAKLPKLTKGEYSDRGSSTQSQSLPLIKVEEMPVVDLEQENQVEEYVEEGYEDYEEGYDIDEEGYDLQGSVQQPQQSNMMRLSSGVWIPQSTSKKFPCEICNKKYSNKNSLLNHMGIHRGVTHCDVCNTVFSSKSNLNFHMKNVHGLISSTPLTT
ncbi:protein tramtrack, beta isoform isoform X3 [Eurytemora carolleeae]|uniref:protein tramtrack, beta isoform isoform X3 n=1 Tax=Eurytemora carolleeae TaxID=1294199 RepID=UPI000C77573F|nr:protein tramtrack, beta isoform isoform X3 [Eurytemora carolleeae]|eukprot:XP_023327404.1 protein tramtrack, beta isoform-like isoform X3 [Eurytemora affinis]